MALKYQALNGTVISKTIEINGFDIEKIGSSTPQLQCIIPSYDKTGYLYVYAFGNYSTQTGDNATAYFSETIFKTSPSPSDFAMSIVEINGKQIAGFAISHLYCAGTDAQNKRFKFTIKCIRVSRTTNEIYEQYYYADFTTTSDMKQTRIIFEKSSDPTIFLTFEPAQ